MIKFLIFLGWRGKRCQNCGFHQASHFDYNLQWHPDLYPCKNFEIGVNDD